MAAEISWNQKAFPSVWHVACGLALAFSLFKPEKYFGIFDFLIFFKLALLGRNVCNMACSDIPLNWKTLQELITKRFSTNLCTFSVLKIIVVLDLCKSIQIVSVQYLFRMACLMQLAVLLVILKYVLHASYKWIRPMLFLPLCLTLYI